MLNTHELVNYLIARRIDGTDTINAAFDDPVLLQAELDGYAERRDGQWIGKGDIQPGERRKARHIFGDESEVIGR